MANARLVSGVALIAVGLLFFTNIIPLSAAGSAAISNMNVSCGNNVCTFSAVITNPGTWPGSDFIDFWTCIPSLDAVSGAQCGSVNSYVILLNEQTQGLPVGVPVTVSQVLTCGSNAVECSSSSLPMKAGIIYSEVIQVMSSPVRGVQATSNEVQFTTGGNGQTTSTSISISQSGVFSIFYPTYVTLSSITPTGTNPAQCTSACPSGLNSYSATWVPGTTLSLVVSFPSTYNLCWQYSNGGTCTPVTSGSPFNIPSQAFPGYAVLTASTNNQAPVTINACAGAPNPCQATNSLGSWNPGSVTLSATGTSSVSFGFTSAPGYICSTNWYLFSPGTNQNFLTGNGVAQFTWQQVQALEATQGTTFDLLVGTPTGGNGCQAAGFTLTVQPSPTIQVWDCSTSGPNINVYVCPQVQTFYSGTVFVAAVPANQYGNPAYTLDGNPITPTTGNWITIQMNNNHVVVGTASCIGTCPGNGFGAGQVLGGILAITGGGLTFLGLRRKR